MSSICRLSSNYNTRETCFFTQVSYFDLRSFKKERHRLRMFPNYLQLEDKRGKETKGGQCLTIHESRWREYRHSLDYDFKFPVAWKLIKSNRQRRRRAIMSPAPGRWCEALTSGPIAIPSLRTDWSSGRDPTQTCFPHLYIRNNNRTHLPRVSVKMTVTCHNTYSQCALKKAEEQTDGSHWVLDEVTELLTQVSRNSPSCRLSIMWDNSPPYKPL